MNDYSFSSEGVMESYKSKHRRGVRFIAAAGYIHTALLDKITVS